MHSYRQSKTLLILLLLVAYGANADEGIVLDCTRYDGTQKLQIYINVSKGYVLYNAHLRNSFERIQQFTVKKLPGSKSADTEDIDLGLDITRNDDWVLEASRAGSSFLYVKLTDSFAYAWTTPIPNKDGTLVAFGNHHAGTCSQRPVL